MAIVVEGSKSFYFGGLVSIVEDGREMAWAEQYIRKAPDIKWLVASYVQTSTAENEQANSNGHIFPYEDVKSSIKDIPHRPLNINHIPNRQVGTITAAEFVWPTGESAAENDAPVVEILAAYWYYYHPELFPSIELAYKEGSLFASMEAVPKTITCRGNGISPGCNKTYEYDGRSSPTYCDHLNEKRSRKTLNSPSFVASALIIPPIRPGWKDAHIKEMSQVIESSVQEAEIAYNQISEEAPHLNPASWEKITAFFLASAK